LKLIPAFSSKDFCYRIAGCSVRRNGQVAATASHIRGVFVGWRKKPLNGHARFSEADSFIVNGDYG
jgi:hypothetical protein